MNEVIVLSNRKASVSKEGSGVRISCSSDTSKAAREYAVQLQNEFREMLYEPMAKADIKVAGRFFSLIQELAFMVERTEANIKAGR